MYRVLIVDDEPRHRIGLANMIKRLRPAYKVSKAKNGADALQFVNTNQVDIIITDIKMPIMNGLQLIEHLGKRVKDINIIILSAFGYFEYAQKAISVGAFDYLIKPLDEIKVIEMLNKVESEIERKKNEKQEKESLKKQLDYTLPVYIDLLLTKWVKGSANSFELEEIEKLFPFKGKGTIIASEISNFNVLKDNYTIDEINEIQFNIKYCIKDVLNPIGHSISFFLQDEDVILITILNSSENINFHSEDNICKLNEFIQYLKIRYGFDITIGIGNICDSVFDKIKSLFEQAKTALNYKFFLGNGRVIFYFDISISLYKQPFSKYKEEGELAEAIRLGDIKAINIMDCIIKRMVSGGYPDPNQFIDTVVHIIINLLKIIQDVVEKEKYNQLLTDIPKKLRDCENYEKLTLEVKEITSEIINTLNNQKNRKNEIILEKCLDYIEKHYMGDISLESVADVFYFNVSYFSSLFKNQTGINFSQHLRNKRLNKSRGMLEKTNRKVYEISKAVGYKDSKYFNRVFKKEFGMAPDEYRRLIRGMSN